MAISSPKMGLRVWLSLLDEYDHDQLANNWLKVDMHDHTPGRGVQLTTESIASNSIAKNQIIDEAITTSKIAPGAVTGSKLGTETVRGEEGSPQTFLSWGFISSAGVVEAGTSDYTVSKISTGLYEVKWNTEKTTDTYAVNVTLQGEDVPDEASAQVREVTTGRFKVFLAASEAFSASWSFIVVAVS